MRNAEKKFCTQNSHNWLSAVKFAETRRKLRLVPTNANLYHYSANNPVKYTDPDGRIQIKKDGEFIFYVKIDFSGNPKVTQKNVTPKTTINVEEGYIKTNDGTEINVFYNRSRDAFPEYNYDCHGFTFTDGTFWINDDEVEKILIGDGYEKSETLQKGDILVQRNKAGNVYHSAKIIEVDKKNDRVAIREALGAHLFTDSNGKKHKTRERWYKLDPKHDTVYSPVKNAVKEDVK